MTAPSERTIYAVSSGRVRSGVAVIRVSGPRSRAVLEDLAGGLPEPRRAAVRTLVSGDTREPLDQVLVLWMPGPASFTGEDVVELHVHGGPAVIAAVLDALGRISGLCPAEAGEFTRRAFANGRLDLTQVEALADLINADTEAQRRQAQRQMSGAVAEVYESWRGELVRCLAYFEAEIDFPDEGDVPEDVAARMKATLIELRTAVADALRDERRGERLRDGLRVVIAGRPNVGKSSLLNALAQRDAAIVSETAGTTRDVIEVHMDLRGYPVNLIDTAGLRDSADSVEQEGVARARGRLEDADLVLWVTDPEDMDAGRPDDLQSREAVWTVLNKSDLADDPERVVSSHNFVPPVHCISAKTGVGLSRLVGAISDTASEVLAGGESAVVTRARHRKALQDCTAHLDAALAAWTGDVELVAEDLRLAARALGRVTGRVDVEDLLDVIFRDFCIGK